MSFKKSDSKIKSFVTEEEAHDINEERQKEWERVRQPEDPLKCPEAEPRSLFEQLQEQKEKAQQDHDEKYNIKNMFRGIDNDEAAFLEFASKQQAEIDRRRFVVTTELEEYRNEVAQLQTNITTPPLTAAQEKEKKKPSTNALLGKKKSQVELLAGCIKTKRKRSDAENSEEEKNDEKEPTTPEKTSAVSSEVESEDSSKKPCTNDGEADSSSRNQTSAGEEVAVIDGGYGSAMIVNQIGFIPSLGVYSDSSDSESSSSDSDILPSLFSFRSKPKQS